MMKANDVLIQAKPCPVCANEKLEFDGWEHSWNVYCPKCGNAGPVDKKKSGAVASWNMQSTKTANWRR